MERGDDEETCFHLERKEYQVDSYGLRISFALLYSLGILSAINSSKRSFFLSPADKLYIHTHSSLPIKTYLYNSIGHGYHLSQDMGLSCQQSTKQNLQILKEDS